MNMFKLYTNKLIFAFIVFALLFIQSINSIPVNITKRYEFSDFWNDTCALITIFDKSKAVALTCIAGSIIGKLDLSKGFNDRILQQIPADTCEITPNGVTEVCSTPPFQLYFKASGYIVNGCYQNSSPGSTFYQCCQFRHELQSVVPKGKEVIGVQKIPYWGEFCSGPNSKDPKFKPVPQHGLSYNLKETSSSKTTDLLFYYRTQKFKEICDKDWRSTECYDSRDALNDLYNTLPINWHTVKKL